MVLRENLLPSCPERFSKEGPRSSMTRTLNSPYVPVKYTVGMPLSDTVLSLSRWLIILDYMRSWGYLVIRGYNFIATYVLFLVFRPL